MYNNYYDALVNLKENRDYNIDNLIKISNSMEDELGAAEMWKTIVLGFSSDELLENLIYIAHEHNI